MQTEQSQTEAVLPASIFRVPETIDLPSPVVGASHQPVSKHHHQDTPGSHVEVYQEKTHEELIALMAAWPSEKACDPDASCVTRSVALLSLYFIQVLIEQRAQI